MRHKVAAVIAALTIGAAIPAAASATTLKGTAYRKYMKKTCRTVSHWDHKHRLQIRIKGCATVNGKLLAMAFAASYGYTAAQVAGDIAVPYRTQLARRIRRYGGKFLWATVKCVKDSPYLFECLGKNEFIVYGKHYLYENHIHVTVSRHGRITWHGGLGIRLREW